MSAECEIAIEVHCDAGGILAKSGSRAHMGIRGLLRKPITPDTKIKLEIRGCHYPGLVSGARRWLLLVSHRGTCNLLRYRYR